MTKARDNPPPPARTLGRYQLDQRLGSEGLLETHRARVQGLAGFDRIFAVKVLIPGALMRRPDAAERLLAAGRRAGTIKDPRVVPVRDMGLAPGCAYVVSEFVHGATLSAFAGVDQAKEPMGVPTARWPAAIALLGAEVAGALAAGHALVPPLAHGALGPGNVMLTPQGAVRVLDLGIRAEIHSPMELGTSRTRRPYLAPEVVAGQAPGPAADLFALGTILLELATGQPAALIEDADKGAARMATLPTALALAVRSLLESDPGKRPPAARAAELLKAAAGGASEATARADLGALARALAQRAPRVVEAPPPAATPMGRPTTEVPLDAGEEAHESFGGKDEPTTMLSTSADGKPVGLGALLEELRRGSPDAPGPGVTAEMPRLGAGDDAPDKSMELELSGDVQSPLPAPAGNEQTRGTAPPLPVVKLPGLATGPAPRSTLNEATTKRETPRGLDVTGPARATPPPFEANAPAPFKASAPAPAREHSAAPAPAVHVDAPEAELPELTTGEVSAAFPAELKGDTAQAPIGIWQDGGAGIPGSVELTDRASFGDFRSESSLEGIGKSQGEPAAAPVAPLVAPSRRRWLPLALAGGVLIVGGGAAVMFGGGTRAASNATSGSSVTPAQVEPPAPAQAASAARSGAIPGEPTASASQDRAADPAKAPAEGAPAADPSAEAGLPEAREVALSSEPPGAAIWVDGKELGKTPSTAKLPAGAKQVRLVRVGYRSATAKLGSATGAALSLPLEPTVAAPWGKAIVVVTCKTRGKLPVLVDGAETGLLCPTPRLGLQPGQHEIGILDPASGEVEKQALELRVGARYVRFKL